MTVADDRNGVAVAPTYRNNVVALGTSQEISYYIIYLYIDVSSRSKLTHQKTRGLQRCCGRCYNVVVTHLQRCCAPPQRCGRGTLYAYACYYYRNFYFLLRYRIGTDRNIVALKLFATMAKKSRAVTTSLRSAATLRYPPEYTKINL